jgi:hypothetical protein
MKRSLTIGVFAVGSLVLAACSNSFPGLDGSGVDDWTAHLTGTEEPAVYPLPQGGTTTDPTVAAAASRPAHPIPSCTSDKKQLVCHIPPGNPANMHTICVSVNAVQTHVTHHGDPVGPCAVDLPVADAGTSNPPVVEDAGSPPLQESPTTLCAGLGEDCLGGNQCCDGLVCNGAYVCDLSVGVE